MESVGMYGSFLETKSEVCWSEFSNLNFTTHITQEYSL
jgi:hypothetical protein